MSESNYKYDGTPKCPVVTIGDLIENTDFTVKYSNNINEGTATATVTGIGNYSGTIKKTFTIEKEDISGYPAVLSQEIFDYDGTEKCPDVTILNLVKDTDFTVSYMNNVKAGEATATITGIRYIREIYSGETDRIGNLIERRRQPGIT